MHARALSIVPLAFALAVAQPPRLTAEEFRTWTNAENKQVEAAFSGIDGANVKLKLRNGTIAPVPLEKLSAADQEWVTRNTEKKSPGPAGAPAPKGNGSASKDWPRTVTLPDPPKATVVKEDAGAKEFIYRTEHFEFRCDARLGTDVVREFGRMFEGTRMVNCTLPLGLDPTPEKGQDYFVARLYSSKEDYQSDGGIKGSAGVYSPGAKSIKVPLESLGVKLAGKRYMVEPGHPSDTLIHEITHQMMNHWLGKLPQWYVEGSAMYVGSCVFHPSGSFTLPRLGQSVKGLQHLRQGKHTIWHLSYLMQITPKQWAAGFGDNPDGTVQRNYTSASALTYYLYNGDDKGDGAHMIDFMSDIAGGKKWPEAQGEHLIRGRDYAQMEKELVTTLRKGGVTVEFADGPAASSGDGK
jgi:hypothetical protein